MTSLTRYPSEVALVLVTVVILLVLGHDVFVLVLVCVARLACCL